MENGLEDNLDPFKDIDPIETADEVSNNLFVTNKMYISQQNLDDDDSDWEGDDGNIFDVFIEHDDFEILKCLLKMFKHIEMFIEHFLTIIKNSCDLICVPFHKLPLHQVFEITINS